MNTLFNHQHWALILGGSSGFGLASAKKLSQLGMSVCVVHRDRRGAMQSINEEFDSIRKNGNPFISLNLDALSAEGQAQTINTLKENMGQDAGVRVLLHSIAFGNLKLIAPSSIDSKEALITDEDMAQTIYSMGTSLLTWTQKLFNARLFAQDARVLSLTSEGNKLAWRGYAAVSAAKVALEAVSRSIATEFAAYGIRSNVIQAGVTDTAALRAIPGSDHMKEVAATKNPFKRLTLPGDIGNIVALLAMDEASWINGAIIRADGGEEIAAY